MVYGLPRLFHFHSRHRIFARIQIAVEPREVAAGYVQPDAMPRQKCIARRPQIDIVFVDFAGLKQGCRRFLASAVTRADNPVLDILGIPVGVHIDKLGRPVRVFGACGRKKLHCNRPGHLDSLAQHRRGVNQHVIAHFRLHLIYGAGRNRVTA